MKRLLVVLFLLCAGPVLAQQQPWDDKVSLSWDAGASPNVTYNVYRRQGACSTAGQFTKINTTPVTPLTFLDTNVSAGTTYCYVVTSVDVGGIESVPSNSLTVSLPARPAPPTNLRRNP